MNELLESLVCAGTECFCWILVLFNLLAVFYLVFCSFWKVSGLVKIFGWIQSGVLICVAIVTLFYHTCIYTLLATIFTGMMLMAIFSIILPQQEKSPKTSKPEKAQPKSQTKTSNKYLILTFLTAGMFWGFVRLKRKKR